MNLLGGMMMMLAEGAGAARAPQEFSPLRPVLFQILEFGAIMSILGMMLCLYRMVRGPHLADRVLSGDTISWQVVGLVILLTVRMESTIYLDAALVVAIIGFASTLAFAQYIGNPRRQANP